LIDDLLKKYPNDLRVVVKQFPLSFHKQARKASIYALAAEKQGKYMEMSDKIFANYRQLKTNEDLPRQYAEELGLDMVQFDKDVKDPALDARISKEINQMKQSGIPRMSVPKFLINGKEPQGKRDVANYSAFIEAELKNKK
jgi:protein-disulfide isomerase